ncbi:hypothetical protein HK100_012319 [Physocladia obscura]|uniref:Uncharacterized protein n=1 Tax=Physocladia obscura TaxID=109957 RepID=A0AAD5TAZ4_9FUNG|nr:hypothetical protein HK100_012319 [Physocladia obscura]
MLLYAGFRGHKVATQLPATYRTTQQPNLIPIEYFDDLFPSAVPSASFEFPAVTVCADDPAATLSIVSCYKTTTATNVNCDSAGTASGNLEIEGNSLSCTTVNQSPGNILIAGTADDTFSLSLTVSGTRANYHDGILVYVHDQSVASYQSMFNVTFDNFFTASTYTVAEVAVRKIIEIDLDGNYEIDFETKVSYLGINISKNASLPSPIVLEIKYPTLEVVYEKAFLPIDMFNWLGEVGGVSSLLYLLHNTVVYIVPLALLRFDRYTDVKGKRANNYESFAGY